MHFERRFTLWVVDDEQPMIDLITASVDWNGLNIRITATALSADALLARLKHSPPPDILLSDILMPGTNGIELAQEFRAVSPETVVVLLTGHERFDYARQAIQARVFTLLLKPITTSDLEEAMREATRECMKRGSASDAANAESEHLHAFILEEHLRGNITADEDTQRVIPLLGIGRDEDTFQVALVPKEETESQIAAFLRTSETEYREFELAKTRLILVSNPSVDLTGVSADECTYVGGLYPGFAGIRRSYFDAKRKHREANGTVRARSTDINTDERINLLGFFLTMGNENRCLELLEDLLSHGVGVPEQDNAVKALALRIASRILDTLPETGVSPDSISTAGGVPLNETILALTDPEEMMNQLGNAARSICQQTGNDASDTGSVAIRQIKDYVEKNFRRRDLTLGELSTLFDLNPSYISRAFKQHAGCNFKEYIIRLRIQAAAELLKTHDAPAYVLAEKVGFSEPHYFSTCFKKHMGVSVREFRRRFGHATHA